MIDSLKRATVMASFRPWPSAGLAMYLPTVATVHGARAPGHPPELGLHAGSAASILAPLRSSLIPVTDTAWFWTVFPITLVLLSSAVWTGRRSRRRIHLRLAPLSLAFLGLAIWMAIRMGQARVFPEEVMAIHRPIATLAAVLVVPVIGSGIALYRSEAWRRVHRICVTVFLGAALTATGTGIWAFSMSTPV